MKITRLLLLAALPLLLSACAPAAGASVAGAVPLRGDRAIPVERGRELFVSASYPLTALGLSPRELEDEFWIPGGVGEETANIIRRAALRNPRLPAGWMLELERLRAVRAVDREYGRPVGPVQRRVEAVYRIRVPADAELGETVLTAELNAGRGASAPVSIPLRVRLPEQL